MEAHVEQGSLPSREGQVRPATPAKVAMWIFLLSDAFSFFGLLLAYGILRAGSHAWHNPGEPELAIPFTALLTFDLICSSVTMIFAYEAAQEGKRSRATLLLALTALGGLLFLLGQYAEYFGILHPGLSKEGLVFGRTPYASTFYVITSFHGLHVFSGVVYISVLLVRNVLGKATAASIELCGLFWHFVDLVWICVFTLVYLVPSGS